MSTARPRSGASSIGALLVSLLGAWSPMDDTHASDLALPSIIAEHVRRHAPSDTDLARVRVELSPRGLRVRDRSGGQDIEVIQDFATERLWFVDRERRVAHEVELPTAPPEPTSNPDPVGERPAEGRLLGTSPCEGADARAAGDGTWRGRAVSVWSCRDANDVPVAGEFVDHALGLVVRRETIDGVVDELRDIRSVAFGADHFSPSSRLRRVGHREFVLGAPAIVAFDERTENDPSTE